MAEVDYKPVATRVAKRYGIPVGVLHGLVQQESGWNPSARNPSGATGLMQIHLPSHPDISEAQALNPRFALNWGAKYLKSQFDRFGSWKLALAAYNAGPGNVESGRWQSFPETRNYVKSVLGYAGAGATATPTPAAPVVPGVSQELPTSGPDLAGLALSNLSSITAAGKPQSPLDMLTGLTMNVAASKLAVPQAAPGTPPSPSAPAPQDTTSWQAWVGTPEKRSGPSKPHTPAILQFVGRVGQIAQTKLTPWGNESHSLTTVNGRPSAHGSGNAADIPAVDAENIRVGRAALAAAGMNPKLAAKAKPGLYNVGGYQIIFGVNAKRYGGNHLDHVHVGMKR